MDGTELSEAIQAVRDGLAAAQREGQGSELRFTVKEVVLDLALELRTTGSAGGGVKAFVVSGEARGERARTNTHRMSVTLDLQDASHNPISDVGDLGQVPDPFD